MRKPPRRTIAAAVLLAAAWSACVVSGCAPLGASRGGALLSSAGAFGSEELARHVGFLADPALGGRMVGTAGNAAAGEYIAKAFAAAGLKPGGDDGGWFQRFPVRKIRVPAPSSVLAVVGNQPLRLHQDFSPMAVGAPGAFEGPLVLAGYGITSRSRRYDDYADVDARGAVVMIMRGEPHDAEGNSRWAPTGRWSYRARLRTKLRRAAEAGAAAVLVVTPPAMAGKHDLLYNVLGKGDGAVPAMRISVSAAERLLAAGAGGKTLGGVAAAVNATGRPASFAVAVKVAGRADLTSGVGRNVVGVLPATTGDGQAKIVVGAHYDHLSIWGHEARDRGFGVRCGADDNASGVAAMILVAKALAGAPRRRCSYVLVAFDGEEYGFLGSNHFTAAGTGCDEFACMLCFDQVGRMRRNELVIVGNVWDKPIARALRDANHAGLALRVWALPIVTKRRWSDHSRFAARGVPTLLLHTGTHRDYHRRTDTAARINPAGAARAARLAFETLRRLEGAGMK